MVTKGPQYRGKLQELITMVPVEPISNLIERKLADEVQPIQQLPKLLRLQAVSSMADRRRAKGLAWAVGVFRKDMGPKASGLSYCSFLEAGLMGGLKRIAPEGAKELLTAYSWDCYPTCDWGQPTYGQVGK